MRFEFRSPAFPFEQSALWSALDQAIEDLESRGSLHLIDGRRVIVAAICRSLHRAGVVESSERPGAASTT
jgi:hypothetical protein